MSDRKETPNALRTKSDQVISDLVNSLWKIVLYSVLSYVTIVILYSMIEGESLFRSAWWTSVTAYTVGYGDMYPNTAVGKILGIATMSIFWLFLQLLQVNIIVRYLRNEHEFTDAEQKEVKATLSVIIRLIGRLLVRQRVILTNQRQIMRDLADIKAHLGIEADPDRTSA